MDYVREPGLLIVGDCALAAPDGLRLMARVPIAAAMEAMADYAFDALLLCAEAKTMALATVLERVGADGVPAVLVLPPDLLDLGWSLAPDAMLLSDPTDAELSDALVAVLAPVEAAVAERRDRPEELRRLSAEVGRIAQALADMSIVAPPADALPEAAQIRALIRARRLRDRFFDAALFADPAWDMMLDLYAAGLERGQVAVSSLCIAAAVPTTTALRWIKSMTDAGLFVRVADPGDGRRFFIALAEPVRDGLSAYFVELRRQGLTGG